MNYVHPSALNGVPIELKGDEGDPAEVVTKALDELRTSLDERVAKLETKSTERLDKLEARLNRPAGTLETKGNDPAVEHKALADLARTGAPIEVKTMSVGSDPDGGYVVLPTVEGTIRKIARDYSPIRDLASSVTISKGDSYEIVLDMDDVGATWVGETAARPVTSSPTLKVASIPVHEIYAMPMITQKLLDDAAFDLGAFLEGKIADKFARTEPLSFASGDGVGKPRGFLTYATAATKDFTRAWGQFQHVAAGSTTPTDKQLADALVAVTAALRSPYRAGATWLMPGDTALRIRQIKDTTDHYIWQPSLQAGQPDQLLGYPVAICEDMPAIGSGNTPVALASWKAAYQIVDRHGLRLLRDPFTAKPHTLFYAYKRVGGDVVDFNALKFLKISNS